MLVVTAYRGDVIGTEEPIGTVHGQRNAAVRTIKDGGGLSTTLSTIKKKIQMNKQGFRWWKTPATDLQWRFGIR